MENVSVFTALTRGWRLYRLSWKSMAAYAFLVWITTLCLLSPLVSWVLNRLIARSGELVVGNSEILGWLLSPKGLITLLLSGSLTLMGFLLYFAGMIRIVLMDDQAHNRTVSGVLNWLKIDLLSLFRFCLSAFLLCLLMLLPLVGCLFVIYAFLLGSHDINYYLVLQPSEWKWALALAGICITLWAFATGWFLLRWIYALPLWIKGLRPFRMAIGSSWNASRQQLRSLLRVTGAYLSISILSLVILEAGLLIIAGLASSRFDQAVHPLFFAISVYLVLAFILEMVITFIAFSWGACILVVLYRDHVEVDALQLASEPRELSDKDSSELPTSARLRPGIVVLAIFVLFLTSGAVNALLLSQKSEGKTPLVIAHRAGALHAPENTLAALEIAIDQGADYAEIDVQRSRDGVVVVIHDQDLMKMALSPLRVRDNDYDDLAQVDIGRKFDDQFAGERLARLSDFLNRASGKIKLMIELKYYGIDDKLAEETVRAVRKAGMSEEVSLMSLEMSGVRQLQQLVNDMPVGFLSAVSLGSLTRLDVDFLAVSTKEAKRAFLRRAGRKELPVYVWTVNDVDTMLAMLELGVDGLITDDPAMAAEVIAKVKELLPAERLMLRFRNLWDPLK